MCHFINSRWMCFLDCECVERKKSIVFVCVYERGSGHRRVWEDEIGVCRAREWKVDQVERQRMCEMVYVVLCYTTVHGCGVYELE